MVVRFDNKALQQTVDRKTEPIGVDGDPLSKIGGISEAEAIVEGARKNMGDAGATASGSEGLEEEKSRVGNDILEEEEEPEPGPELDPNGIKLARPAK